MDLRDAFYHGIRQQIRRVLDGMGDERIDKGLTAFEDGASNWSCCFFARAYEGELDLHTQPELQLMKALGLTTFIPIKIVYHTFDSDSVWMNKKQLYKFISDVRDDSRPQAVLDLLRSIDYSKVEETSL